MPSTFGQWLSVVLGLLLGLTAGWRLGWVSRGRQEAAAPVRPVVDRDPVAGATVVASPPVPAAVGTERPEPAVDPAPATTAVIDEPVPADGGPTPAGAVAPVHADPEPTVADTAPKQSRPTAGEIPAPVIPAPRSANDDAEPATAGAGDPATTPADPTPLAGADQPAEAEAPQADGVVPVAATTPTTAPETADDFRRIQGIGPKLAAALQDAGIRSYRQLAALDEEALRETIRTAGLRATPSLATWPQQARVLAGAPAEADRVPPAAVGSGADA